MRFVLSSALALLLWAVPVCAQTPVQAIGCFTIGGTSVTCTFANPTAIGDQLYFVVGNYYPDGSNQKPWTVTDSGCTAGWSTADADKSDAGDGTVDIFSATANAIVANCAITLTATGGATYDVCAALEYSGLAATPFDKTSGNAELVLNTNPYTSGLTGTTSQANELLIGAHHGRDTAMTLTPDAPWTSVIAVGDATFHQLLVKQRIVSSTGTYASTGVLVGTSNVFLSETIATYKASGSPPPPTVVQTGLLLLGIGGWQ